MNKLRWLLGVPIFFVGWLYITSPQAGILRTVTDRAYNLLADQGWNAPAQLASRIQAGLLLLGFHHAIVARLSLGLAFIVIGSALLFVGDPRRAIPSLFQVLASVVTLRNVVEREKALANHIRQHFSIIYKQRKGGDPVLLIAGVLNWGVKAGLLSLVFIAAFGVSNMTYSKYSQAMLVSNIVKEKLATYLTEVQLGGIPDHARNQFVDMQALMPGMAALKPEFAYVDSTLRTLELLNRRLTLPKPNSRDSSAAQRAQERLDIYLGLSEAQREMNHQRLFGRALAQVDPLYPMAYVCSRLLLALDYLNAQADAGLQGIVDTTFVTIIASAEITQENKRLFPTRERVDLLRQSIKIGRKSEWEREPRIVQGIDGLAGRQRKLAIRLSGHEEMIVATYNACMLQALKFRIVSELADSKQDEFRDYVADIEDSLQCAGSGNAARIYSEYARLARRVEELFPANGFVHVGRAEVYAFLKEYLETHWEESEGLEHHEDLLRALQADTRVKGNRYGLGLNGIGGGRGVVRDSAMVALSAELVLALDSASRTWRSLNLWEVIGEQREFCDGVFQFLYSPGVKKNTKHVVRLGFVRAKVDYPFADKAGRG